MGIDSGFEVNSLFIIPMDASLRRITIGNVQRGESLDSGKTQS